MSLIKRITNHLRPKSYDDLIGNSLDMYLESLLMSESLIEESGDTAGLDIVRKKRIEVENALARNDIFVRNGRLLMPDGLIAEASE
jgi:hypothetical protein